MNIIGEKVILRAITMDDALFLMKLINDTDTERMLGGSSFPVSIDEQRKWIGAQVGRQDVLRCIIAKKENESEGIGTIILTDIDYKNGVAQVHIKMDKENGRGKGFGIDALNSMVDYAFKELRLNCIYADVLSYNEISQNLFKKAGFSLDGILRSRVFKNGRFIDVYSFSKVRDKGI